MLHRPSLLTVRDILCFCGSCYVKTSFEWHYVTKLQTISHFLLVCFLVERILNQFLGGFFKGISIPSLCHLVLVWVKLIYLNSVCSHSKNVVTVKLNGWLGKSSSYLKRMLCCHQLLSAIKTQNSYFLLIQAFLLHCRSEQQNMEPFLLSKSYDPQEKRLFGSALGKIQNGLKNGIKNAFQSGMKNVFQSGSACLAFPRGYYRRLQALYNILRYTCSGRGLQELMLSPVLT